MHAERQHSIESGRWRVRIDHASLHGPGSPTGPILLPPQRQRGVLVPDHEPVRVCRLVEECRAIRYGFRPKHFAGKRQKAGVMRKVSDDRKLHGMTGSRAAARERCTLDRIRDRADLSLAEHPFDDRKALRVDVFGK